VNSTRETFPRAHTAPISHEVIGRDAAVVEGNRERLKEAEMAFTRQFFEKLSDRVVSYARGKQSTFGPTVRVLTYEGAEAYVIQRVIESQDGWVAFAYYHEARAVKPEGGDSESPLYPVVVTPYETIKSVEFDWSDPRSPLGFSTEPIQDRRA
jgi:hypothetical protein